MQNFQFLGISWYKLNLRLWINLNLYHGIWVSEFGEFRRCSIFTGNCHTDIRGNLANCYLLFFTTQKRNFLHLLSWPLWKNFEGILVKFHKSSAESLFCALHLPHFHLSEDHRWQRYTNFEFTIQRKTQLQLLYLSPSLEFILQYTFRFLMCIFAHLRIVTLFCTFSRSYSLFVRLSSLL